MEQMKESHYKLLRMVPPLAWIPLSPLHPGFTPSVALPPSHTSFSPSILICCSYLNHQREWNYTWWICSEYLFFFQLYGGMVDNKNLYILRLYTWKQIMLISLPMAIIQQSPWRILLLHARKSNTLICSSFLDLPYVTL